MPSEKVTPCPMCDLAACPDVDTATAMAIGVGVGIAFSPDMHAVTEAMCTRHRLPWMIAMLKAATAVQGLVPPEAPRVNVTATGGRGGSSVFGGGGGGGGASGT